ncbi:MAG: putative signaling protein [Xylophilus sp.]|nr:MAG: putative signaling protein [Xylophilus sp.]
MENGLTRLIDASQLRKGLFVQLDMGWMEHPFPVGSFKIVSDEQLQTLRSLGIAQFRIDPLRSDPLIWRALLAAGEAAAAVADAARAPAAEPGLLARERRTRLLAEQRNALLACERRFLESARAYRRTTELVQADPAAAADESRRAIDACVDELAAHGKSAIRLLSEGVGERSSQHPVNVMVISLLLARALGVPGDALGGIGLAALLHDIGKIELPERVRHLDDHFTPAEVRAYQEHVAQSLVLGRRMQLPADVLLAIAQHHEMADGSGFPLRLTGERMGQGGRIVALVNRFDRLCNPPRLALAMTPHEALSLMFAQMNSRFDTTVLGAFIRMMGVYPPGSVVQLVDDRFALVVSVNSSRPLRPRVVRGGARPARADGRGADPGPGIAPGPRHPPQPAAGAAAARRARLPVAAPAPELLLRTGVRRRLRRGQRVSLVAYCAHTPDSTLSLVGDSSGLQGDTPRFLDGVLDAVWIADSAGQTIVWANAAAVRLLGEPVAGQPVERLAVTPEDLAFWGEARAGIASVLHSHGWLRHADGRLVPVERRVSRQQWQGGGVFLVAATDRSEARRETEALEGQLAGLRAALDSTADGILVCGVDGAVRAFNQRFAAIWDVDSALLLRRDDAQLRAHMAAATADAGAYRARLAAIEADLLLEASDVLVLRGGRLVERVSLPQLSHGSAIGRVHVFRDITAMAEAQADVQLAARVFGSSLDAIFIADSGHRVVRANPVAESLTGRAGAELYGRPLAALFDGIDDGFFPVVQTAWSRQGFWSGEARLRQSEGRTAQVQLSWVVVRNVQGEVTQSIGFVRDLTQQHAALERIDQLAFSDALTGLPNLLQLSRRVEFALQPSRRGAAAAPGFAVLFVDLDRFKNINDSLGHPFGDRVLVQAARRLHDCLQPADTLCRLGGDEFVIHLHGADAAAAEASARRLLDAMAAPFVLDGMGFSVGCSVGVALYPQDGQTLDDLIRQADTAMHRVKERARGSFGFYQPRMNEGLLARMRMEHALRQALPEGRLRLHYQPQICLASGCMTGAEALLRWTDPVLGPVSPGVFIPLAEESGAIVGIGAWVIEQAVAQAARWSAGGTPLVVSVNVSAMQFRQPGFVAHVAQTLEAAVLPPALLELELTESILVQDAGEVLERLEALAALGVGLAVDDFGTGYSSLAYLKKFPIQRLKIDQSFVRGLPGDEGDSAIVNAVISIGRALRLEVVAEGVETAGQRAALEGMGCDHFQGFLCAPGMPVAEFDTLARAWNAAADAPCDLTAASPQAAGKKVSANAAKPSS